MKDTNILGNRIKLLRTHNNLTQVELSKALNISNTTLSQYETGQRIPSDDVKMQIAEYFNVSIDYMLGRTDDTSPPELIIPDELKDVKVAFHRGEFEDLTQYEVDRLAEFAKFLKTQRPDDETK